jgi:hypothetical protein
MLPGLDVFLLAAAAAAVALIARPCRGIAANPRLKIRRKKQARFECMRPVQAGAISDAELRLREQPLLSRCAVLGLMHERRADSTSL